MVSFSVVFDGDDDDDDIGIELVYIHLMFGGYVLQQDNTYTLQC